LGPALNLMPSAGWYKSMGHQMRWLHRLSFLSGSERYAASLSYFYFDPAGRRELFSARSAEELSGADAEMALKAPYDAVDGDAVDKMIYADSMIRLPDHPVMISDRMTMAHGLEARSPFMDHRLAEFAAHLPSNLKVRGRNLRYIQRKLAARYLPPEILSRSKQGFSSALPYILKDEYREMYARYLTDSELVKAGVLARAGIQRLLEEHLSGRADHGNRLWLLINSEIWYRMMILGQPKEDFRDAATQERVASAA
jgi:asparagine synthase (glutamine-hydrolysing)